VPVLWDSKHRTIVNNESSDILRIFNSAFNALAKHPEVDLYPEGTVNIIILSQVQVLCCGLGMPPDGPALLCALMTCAPPHQPSMRRLARQD
jgi:hypothetical protein